MKLCNIATASLLLASSIASTVAFTPNSRVRRPLQRSLLATAAEDLFDRNLNEGKLDDAIVQLRNGKIDINRQRWNAIFDCIEVTTGNSEENEMSLPERNTEFPLESAARKQMTDMYETLKDQGKLTLYDACNTKERPAVAGDYDLPPELLEKVLDMPMSSLTPKPTNSLLLAGAAVAILEGIIATFTGIPLDLLVLGTLLAVVCDKLLINGAVFETFLKLFSPGVSKKILRHEAGHFLAAYLLGCPVEGIVLSAWAALQDKRFMRRQVSAGTSFFDPELSKQINSSGQVTRSSLDRYSIIVMGGIAAEAEHYGQADGGAGDEMALIAFLSALGGNQVWNSERIKNQARWGALNAVLLLRHYKPAYGALVDALERGGTLGDCVFAIEKAARDHNLTPLEKPLGFIVDKGASWSTEDPNAERRQRELEAAMAPASTETKEPLNKEQSLQVLREYRTTVEDRLREVQKRLEELDSK